MKIFKVGICKISSLELGTSSEIDCISCSGICCISSLELVRGRVCFLGSVRTERVFLHDPFYPTHPTHETFFFLTQVTNYIPWALEST